MTSVYRIDKAFPFDLSNKNMDDICVPIFIRECLFHIKGNGLVDTKYSKFDGTEYDKESKILRFKFHHWQDSNGNMIEEGDIEEMNLQKDKITEKEFIDTLFKLM